jgi:hypothetical protein
MRMHRTALLILAATLQTACGGGGGGDSGGSGNNPPPPPPTGDTITSTNGQEISHGVVTSTLFVKDLGLPDVAGPFIPTAIVGRPAAAKAPLSRAIGDAVRRGITSARAIETTSEDTINCSLGGAITITTNIANEGTLTEGDVISLVFDACTEEDGTLDGAVDLTMTSVTGDIANPPFSVGMDISIDQVSLVQGDSFVSADGGLGATLSSETPQDLGLLLSGTSLTTVVDSDTITLSDFIIDEIDDLDTGQYTLTLEGTFDSEALGTYDFATTTNFVGASGDFPSEGELVITGAEDTSAHVIALDNVSVVIELDTDGDGEADESIDTTWSDVGS